SVRDRLRAEALDGRAEDVEVERLPDEVVGARVERGIAHRRAAEQADRRVRLPRADDRDELPTVPAPDVEVEQHEVDRFLHEELSGQVDGGRLEHAVVLELEV